MNDMEKVLEPEVTIEVAVIFKEEMLEALLEVNSKEFWGHKKGTMLLLPFDVVNNTAFLKFRYDRDGHQMKSVEVRDPMPLWRKVLGHWWSSLRIKITNYQLYDEYDFSKIITVDQLQNDGSIRYNPQSATF